MKNKPRLTTRNLNQKNFLKWLEKQPDDRKFNFTNIRECLLASFANESFSLAKPYTHVTCNPFEFAMRVNTMGDRKVIKFNQFFQTVSEIAARACMGKDFVFSVESVRCSMKEKGML